MRPTLLVAACALAALASPAEAGGIGNAVNAVGRLACPTAQVALSAAGLIPGAGAILTAVSNGAVFPATVVNPEKMGAGYQAGDQVQVTVHDVNTCRFSVSPAGGTGKSAVSGGGKGPAVQGTASTMSPRAAAAVGVRGGRMDAGGEAALPYIEFGVDAQGRLGRR